MLYALTKILGFLAAPGNVLLILLTVGALLLWTKKSAGLGRCLVGGVVLLWIVIAYTPIVPTVIVAGLENRYPVNPPLPEHIDGIIVLGGAVEEVISLARGQPSVNAAAGRMIETARLARLHPEARVIVSGGNADPWHPEPKEAAVMAQILTDLGVAPERLILEDQSRNTRENAVYSQALAKPAPDEHWVLITSARHMPRSVGIFRHIGWTVIPWPADFRTGGDLGWVNQDLPTSRLTQLVDAMHEWTGLLVYRLLGWTDSLLP